MKLCCTLLLFFSTAGWTMGRPQITPESYWYNFAMGRISNQKIEGNQILVDIQSHHGLHTFEVPQASIADLKIKEKGYRQALHELMGWKTETEDKFRMKKFNEFTGKTFGTIQEWQKWYKANSKNLVWSNKDNRFVIKEK